MKTFDFIVTVAADALDSEVIVHSLRESMVDALPEGTLVLVKDSGVKEYSEQGWKVARNRKFGISVDDAGDGRAPKKKATETVEA